MSIDHRAEELSPEHLERLVQAQGENANPAEVRAEVARRVKAAGA